VFFTVLWFSEASALDALGLTIDDFALSDTSSDFLFLVETQAALLRDAQLLSERLRMARDEALAASRHKSEFLANMSHELRTPLNAIIGFSDYLLTASSSAAGPKQGEYLSDIKSSGQYLLDMVNDLLDLARIEQGKLVLDEETVDFGAAVRDAVRAVTEAARKRSLLIRLGGFDRPFAVRADRRMIRQILLNLLSNAVKFNKDSGTITLSAGETIAGDLSIAIEDTGIGVDPKAIPDLFEPFRQADSQVARTYGGTGLGLAIVRQLVRLHGGDVTMQSTPGIGTTISFNLPAQRILRGHALPQSCSVGDRNRSLTA
jgi:two-component system cell cycle sensor histidine kinase PleC